MDKKIKIFLSCLLIVIPVTTGVTSLFVNHSATLQIIKPIPELGRTVPTIGMHPTPTLFIVPKTFQAKKLTASDAGQIRAFNIKDSARGIVLDNPSKTLEVSPTTIVANETTIAPTTIIPTPTVIPENPSIAPVASSFGGSAQSFGSSRSAFIIDMPSSIILNDMSRYTSSSNSLLQN